MHHDAHGEQADGALLCPRAVELLQTRWWPMREALWAHAPGQGT